MTRKKMFDKMVTFLITNEMYEEVANICERQKMEISTFIRESLVSMINRYNRKG